MHLHIVFMLLLVSMCNNLPQYFNGGPVWRAQPRSISNTHYGNQRFLHNRPPSYFDYETDESNPFVYSAKHDDDDEYTPPQVWGDRSSLVHRTRASQRTVVEEDNMYNSNERNPGYTSSTASNEHISARTRINYPHPNSNAKKHSTRILNHHRRKAPVASSEDMEADDTFYFPGISNRNTTEKSSKEQNSGPFIPDVRNVISKCSKGSTYCVNVENYPSSYIADVLRNSANRFEDLLGEDELVKNVSVSPRIHLLDRPMCESKEILEHPKMAQNKDNKWLYIINQDDYVQGIRVELCQKEGQKCELSDSFPLGYVTECKQKYIYRKLLALDGDGQPGPDSFRLPSCCSCVFKTGGVSMRSSVPKSSEGATRRK